MVKNNLKEVFKKHKVTNRMLAKYFKKSESTISLWRNNKRQPSLHQIYEIAKLLRINIHELIVSTTWEGTDFETYAQFAERIKEKK
ncbi:helix-turn-helix transcriptional regulator [Pseudopedobacter sp.]|uniref:helix-turn-helix transcriptional regulator n=1 Tax=Pseudopedobacter sp. TaxID=1936787 RepID=UPI00333F112D